jgi:hypothetical protein
MIFLSDNGCYTGIAKAQPVMRMMILVTATPCV